MVLDVDTHIALGLHEPAAQEVNGRSNADILKSLQTEGDAPYHPCPEALAETPRGAVTRYQDWAESRIYADTIRDLFVQLPADFDGAAPARLIVFNDGAGYLARDGAIRAGHVLDALHDADEIAQTVGVFVNPGRPPGAPTDFTSGDRRALDQRSFEYDSLTPDYGLFLLEEVLPFVSRELGVSFTTDPQHRTVCGISSGGICAFNTAWQHPDQFRRVLSHCGSFTNIRGGHNFPYLVRTTPAKPLRVLLQSGAADAETLFGDWPLANKTMANALEYAGYDYRFEFGTGGHNLRHGGSIFADSLRWLWREGA